MLLLKRLSRLSFQFKLEIFFFNIPTPDSSFPPFAPSLSFMRLREVVLKHWIIFGGKRRKKWGNPVWHFLTPPTVWAFLPLPATTSITTTKMWKWEEKNMQKKYFRSGWCVNVISHAFMSRFDSGGVDDAPVEMLKLLINRFYSFSTLKSSFLSTFFDSY